MSAGMDTGAPLIVDPPVEKLPPIADCSLVVFIVDRKREKGRHAIRKFLGSKKAAAAFALSGRWLLVFAGQGGEAALSASSEQDLVAAHRHIVHACRWLQGPGKHFEVVHFVDPELRARLIADTQNLIFAQTVCEGTA